MTRNDVICILQDFRIDDRYENVSLELATSEIQSGKNCIYNLKLDNWADYVFSYFDSCFKYYEIHNSNCTVYIDYYSVIRARIFKSEKKDAPSLDELFGLY